MKAHSLFLNVFVVRLTLEVFYMVVLLTFWAIAGLGICWKGECDCCPTDPTSSLHPASQKTTQNSGFEWNPSLQMEDRGQLSSSPFWSPRDGALLTEAQEKRWQWHPALAVGWGWSWVWWFWSSWRLTQSFNHCSSFPQLLLVSGSWWVLKQILVRLVLFPSARKDL